nr:hypothetical protein [Candidatus Woesearchaeota archaeon]
MGLKTKISKGLILAGLSGMIFGVYYSYLNNRLMTNMPYSQDIERAVSLEKKLSMPFQSLTTQDHMNLPNIKNEYSTLKQRPEINTRMQEFRDYRSKSDGGVALFGLTMSLTMFGYLFSEFRLTKEDIKSK